MKTVKNIYRQIFEFENIDVAINDVKRGKAKKREMQCFLIHYEENIITIQNELIWHTYQFGKVSRFIIYEPKKRQITAPCIHDRIIHHALMQIIFPYITRRFVQKSFACMSSCLDEEDKQHASLLKFGKGSLYACYSLQSDLAKAFDLYEGKCDVVCIDIKSFFASIDHRVLKHLLARIFSDKEVLEICDAIIDSYSEGAQFMRTPDGYYKMDKATDTGIGLPIGFVTSHTFGNIVLDVLDHYVMDELGHGLYARYMDDVRIICRDHEDAKRMMYLTDTLLVKKLRLTMHPTKTKIIHVKRGEKIDFLQFSIYADRFVPRESTVDRAMRRLKKLIAGYREGKVGILKIQESYQSFLSYMKCAVWTQKCTNLKQLYIDFDGNKKNDVIVLS